VPREASRIEGTPGTSIRGIAAQSAPLSRRYHSVRTDFILMHYLLFAGGPDVHPSSKGAQCRFRLRLEPTYIDLVSQVPRLAATGSHRIRA
ncbi:MAG: hypothetical protein ACT4QA_10635, partial [Panacagrimonas sp.]